MAINNAQMEVRNSGTLPVPLHLRNAPTKLMKDMGYGQDYKYSHDFNNNFAAQQFLPDKLANSRFYKPQENGSEKKSAEWLKFLWKDRY